MSSSVDTSNEPLVKANTVHKFTWMDKVYAVVEKELDAEQCKCCGKWDRPTTYEIVSGEVYEVRIKINNIGTQIRYDIGVDGRTTHHGIRESCIFSKLWIAEGLAEELWKRNEVC